MYPQCSSILFHLITNEENATLNLHDVTSKFDKTISLLNDGTAYFEKVTATSSDNGTILHNSDTGKMYLKDCTIIHTSASILSDGYLEVDGGVYENTSSGGLMTMGAETIIHSGTFKSVGGSAYSMFLSDSGTLTIHDGNFIADGHLLGFSCLFCNTMPTATINGGTFDLTQTIAFIDIENTIITINDGEFNLSDDPFSASAKANININGGTINALNADNFSFNLAEANFTIGKDDVSVLSAPVINIPKGIVDLEDSNMTLNYYDGVFNVAKNLMELLICRMVMKFVIQLMRITF